MAVSIFRLDLAALILAFILKAKGLPMECKYGPRGSLTVFCTNATPDFFRSSRYRYDNLDETLKCINCTLTTIELGTFDLSLNQLKTVDIRYSKIQTIKPKAFIGLIFMEKLLLSYNPISEIYPGAFIGIRKIKYLELEYAVSHLMPYIFQELLSLEYLNLKNNNLVKIEHGTFTGLVNLKILDLSNNHLESIDGTLEPLINLRALYLTNNKLKTIDKNEFYHLNHILDINLDDNFLQSFAINMEPGSTLRILNLASNQLTAAVIEPQTFQNLSNLEEINFSFNLFSEIPQKFFQGLYRLRIVNFFGNNIKEFSTGTFSGLPHLRTLNMSQNDLQTAKITGKLVLPSLHSLDLSNNEIKNFDYISMIARFPKLSKINLLNNQLPCETTAEMEVLFQNDGIDFVISTSSDSLNVCPTKVKTESEILQQLYNDYKDEHRNDSVIVWMSVLVAISIVLLGILLYIHLFVFGFTTHVDLI